MDRRMKFDAKVIGIIEELKVTHSLGMHERDERMVITAVARVFVQGRLRDPKHTHIYVAAAEFLADCGQSGARRLLSVYESSRIRGREYADLRAEILVNLGKTKEPVLIELILKESRISPDNEVLAAAGEALGYYTDAPLKTRREIVKKLLITYGSVDDNLRTVRFVQSREAMISVNLTRENARETMRAIQAPWNRTLSQLTGRNYSQFPEWFRWQKDNPNWKRPDDKDG